MQTSQDVEPRDLIAEHPFQAVAGALAAGALLGLRASHQRRAAIVDGPRPSRVLGVVLSIAGALVMRAVRELAMQQLARYARERFAGEPGRFPRATA